MRSRAKCFDELRACVETLPVIDCHDHAGLRAKVDDVLDHVASGYFWTDLVAASSEAEVATVRDKSLSLEKRWPVFERIFKRARFTGYAKAELAALERFFGESSITLESVRRMQKRIPDFSDPKVYDAVYEDARIVARIADCHPPLKDVVAGACKLLPGQRVAASLPSLHYLTTRSDVAPVEEALGVTVTSLDEYVGACRKLLLAYKKAGAVTLKDQSAYLRSLSYGNPVRSDAERVFNRILADPRYRAEYDPYDNPLSDYLMHEFMRIARDLDLPVQIHTGHMANLRNDVAKANAAGLRTLLEMHREVRFDLFHANWPYSGDLLYLAKNYPNVAVDLCWVHIIDPLYAKEFLMQAVSSVPHGKIHGFGSDVGGGEPDVAWSHCRMAKDNIAAALADLVDMDCIGIDDAKEIATDWLFTNPNEFFRLGLRFEDFAPRAGRSRPRR
jgi:hypothetical protein